jgi:hypothetical protein
MLVLRCPSQQVHKQDKTKLRTALLEETNKRKASEQHTAQLEQQCIAHNAEIDLLASRLHDSDTKLQQAMRRYVLILLYVSYVQNISMQSSHTLMLTLYTARYCS